MNIESKHFKILSSKDCSMVEAKEKLNNFSNSKVKGINALIDYMNKVFINNKKLDFTKLKEEYDKKGYKGEIEILFDLSENIKSKTNK